MRTQLTAVANPDTCSLWLNKRTCRRDMPYPSSFSHHWAEETVLINPVHTELATVPSDCNLEHSGMDTGQLKSDASSLPQFV